MPHRELLTESQRLSFRNPPAMSARWYVTSPRYGNEPGVLFYAHVSDQYAPFHAKVINAPVRDAIHLLDGLLYQESDLRSKSTTLTPADSPITFLRSVMCWASALRHGSAISWRSWVESSRSPSPAHEDPRVVTRKR